MRNRIVAMILGALCLTSGLVPGVYAEEATHPPAVTTTQPDSLRIEYKENNADGLGALALRLGGGLVLMATLAFAAAWLAKRYLPGLRGYSSDGQSRIQLLESRRVTPRLTLFVLEFEGRRVLLAQSGERLLELSASRSGDRTQNE